MIFSLLQSCMACLNNEEDDNTLCLGYVHACKVQTSVSHVHLSLQKCKKDSLLSFMPCHAYCISSNSDRGLYLPHLKMVTGHVNVTAEYKLTTSSI